MACRRATLHPTKPFDHFSLCECECGRSRYERAPHRRLDICHIHEPRYLPSTTRETRVSEKIFHVGGTVFCVLFPVFSALVFEPDRMEVSRSQFFCRRRSHSALDFSYLRLALIWRVALVGEASHTVTRGITIHLHV